jgi:hypothetical protein
MMAVPLPDLRNWRSRIVRKVAHETAQVRLVHDMRALTEGRQPSGGNGPIVGFATFGNGNWHLAIELLLAHALIQRGAQPRLLLCDMPELPICNERTSYARDIDRCAGCIDDKRDLLEASGLPWHGLRAFVNAESLIRARETAASLHSDAIDAYVEGPWPIGQWLHVSASHYLRCDARGASPLKLDAKRRLLVTAIVGVTAVQRWLDSVAPDIVIAGSGAHCMWRIAFELARARGIPVVCREMGKGGWDQHIYALNADAMSPNLDDEWTALRETPLTCQEAAAVDASLETLPARTYLAAAAQPDSSDAATAIEMPHGHRVIVAFTNVTWDFATAGRDVAFGGVLDWICDAVRVTGRLDRTHLIVRAHPAEASMITRERIVDQIREAMPSLPSHVQLIAPEHPVSAAALIDRADLVLAYNSTAGLEAAMRGRAVVVAGRPHFGGRGFTIDVATREAFAAAIANTPPVEIGRSGELARRYFHLFYERYHVAMGWTTSPLVPPHELVIRSLDELRPGRNPSLDIVCDGILNARQIVLPRLREEAHA